MVNSFLRNARTLLDRVALDKINHRMDEHRQYAGVRSRKFRDTYPLAFHHAL